MASGIVFLLGFAPYIRAILKEGARPVRASWIVWVILDFLVIGSMIDNGSMNWMMAGVVTGASVVLLLSIKHGRPGWSWIDIASMAVASIGAGIWLVLDKGDIALMMFLVAMVAGGIPTMFSAYQRPEYESKWGWSMFSLSCLIQLLAVPTWDLANAGQPISFSITEFTTLAIILLSPNRSVDPA